MYPTRPAWSLVPDFSDSWTIRPMFPSIKIFRQIGRCVGVRQQLFQFRVLRVALVHTHQFFKIRSRRVLVKIATGLKYKITIILYANHMTTVTLYTYGPIRLYRIYVIDELVRQRIQVDADRTVITTSKTKN